MVRQRILTPEEKALWKLATRNDEKFHPQGEEEEQFYVPEPEPAPAARTMRTPAARPTAPAPASHGKPLTLGDLHALDGLAARRFKRGDYPVDRVLDLHGYNRTDAYSTLVRHIRAMDASGERVLAVITGKGRSGEGVLRRELPHWLNDASLRPLILAATHAPYRMGGEGAVLILLKRRR